MKTHLREHTRRANEYLTQATQEATKSTERVHKKKREKDSYLALNLPTLTYNLLTHVRRALTHHKEPQSFTHLTHLLKQLADFFTIPRRG